MLEWKVRTIFSALDRTSLLIVPFDSSASLAAFDKASAIGGICATHVPKTSKKRTRSWGLVAILIFYNEFWPRYVNFMINR